MNKALVIKIAGYTLTLDRSNFQPVPEVYRLFVNHNITSRDHIVHLKVKKGLPSLNVHHLVAGFETWDLYTPPGRWLFAFNPDVQTREPVQIVVIDRQFSYGTLYYTRKSRESLRFPNPFLYPMLEVLFLHISAHQQGMLCHACGVADNNKGIIFLGNSGDGKSTLANLWKECAAILNDDRIIVRKHGKEFWAYGTPWHGDVDLISAGKVPLQKIFFLKQGKENSVSRKTGAEAAAMLLSRSFLPLWNRAAMRYIADLCSRLVASVPCYELSFVPDDSIVEFVKNLPQDQ